VTYAPPAAAGPAPEAVAADGTGAPAADVPGELAALPRRERRRADRGGWFIALVFIPLISYAVLATIALIILWMRAQQTPPSPFEQLPDDGEDRGVKKGQKAFRLITDERMVTAPLPPRLHVGLGDTLRIGELEVKPTRVERKKVCVYVQGFDKPEPCRCDSLVLHLHLRNVSADQTFSPLDNYFDRQWTHTGMPPLTLLEAGPNRFYGGPAAWYPRGSRDKRREWVEGRKDGDPEGLKPGGEVDSFVCTDGGDERMPLLLDGKDPRGARVRSPYRGPLLWRVQVRRGLVSYRNRPLSATAVIGVAFDSAQVEQPGAG
jgi:hypothetical protein